MPTSGSSPAGDHLHEPREKRLGELCDTIGYTFRNLGLLNRALCHSSLGNEGVANYERLEFLGDAILGFLVAENLYRRKPEIPEGELTSRRSLLVSRHPLATVAADLRLGDYVLVGRGLTESTMDSPRILADLTEAVLGAIYLDGGIRAARRFVKVFVLERFQTDHDNRPSTTDAKTRLNQWAQSNALGVPIYEIVATTGPDHDPTFRVSVTLGDITAQSSEVKNKQAGEQEVAAIALAQLRDRKAADDQRGDEEADPGEIQLIWEEPDQRRR